MIDRFSVADNGDLDGTGSTTELQRRGTGTDRRRSILDFDQLQSIVNREVFQRMPV